MYVGFAGRPRVPGGPRVNEIVNGKRGVTPDTALRLAKLFRMSADFWLGLQQSWDLWQTIRAPEAEDIIEIESVPREFKG